MTAKEISEKIFYSPATNGQAKASIEKGEKMIEEYAKKQLMLGGVSQQRELLSHYNSFVNMEYHGVCLDNDDIERFLEWLNCG